MPTGIGAIVEYSLLVSILVRITIIWRVESAFKDCGSARGRMEVALDYLLITLGLLDASYYWMRPATTFRIAPYVRFCLAVSIPWVRDLFHSFCRVFKAILKVFFFLMGTVVIFAWVAAMIFDDMDTKDSFGTPINQGFESFGNALYTSFATMTTSITPDAMIPSYAYSRSFVLLWLPFLVLATVIFNNVLLATVYSEYQSHQAERVQAGLARRQYSVEAAFEIMKEQTPSGEFIVHFKTFVKVARMLRAFQPISVDESLLRLIYEALDENHDGTLDESEFFVMCDVLQTQFTVTRRDSWFKIHFGETCLGRMVARIMDNFAEGPNFGYPARFQGSCFDHFMNFVLAMNVAWVILQSAVDLNDMQEPDFFQTVDIFFSLIYLLEVGMKLLHWSWGEYWQNNDNRFDFITTMVLAASAMGYLFFDVDRSLLRYLNLLRLVRLLKALNNISAYREVWSVIDRMVRTCLDVLAMNFLVIYLWSAAGVQLFGGQLYESNPRLAGQDLAYFSSHYQVYNFNDMFMGMITLYYFTLGTWIDPLASACMELADKYTFQWSLNYIFLLSFYVASPLLAFNVFTSFSIDVFCNLQDMDREGAPSKFTKNVAHIQTKMADEGYCLHVQESAELSRARVFRKMFGK
uniref:EF-hand domain-containing protein n=1 Tax=Alexandrium andersonii TaxID=327968 RepID=A0A7S2HY09_9DINO